MAEKALKATEVFFDTANHGEAAVMGFKMSRPLKQCDIVGEDVITFFFDKKQLDWLVFQMAQYVKLHKKSEVLWTPR